MKKYSKTFYYSIFIIFAAQLSINMFVTNFQISLGAILLSVFFLLAEEFPLIPVTFCSAAGIYFLRTIICWIQSASTSELLLAYLPEAFFYCCYGLMLYMYSQIEQELRRRKGVLLAALTVIDFAANLSELLLRMRTDALSVKPLIGVLFIAFFRSMVAIGILFFFESYRQLLVQREHEKRYRRLLFLISKLNGEMLWMQKNVTMIEDTMNVSYKLFERLQASGIDAELSGMALSVAKDIHEVKKEYLLIMRGVFEALDQEAEIEGMYLADILLLLKNAILAYAKEESILMDFRFHCSENLYTTHHYAFLSVFRNLYVNALEASKSRDVLLTTTQTCETDSYLFQITDNGPGISSDYIEQIFHPGFSTKINYETGTVNRGLGLSLVKDLVEQQLQGEIQVDSEPGNTTFSIRIPKNILEVKEQ